MPRTQGWGTVGKGPPACLPKALGDTPHVFRRHRSNHENVRTQGQRVTVLFVPPVGETDCGSGPSGSGPSGSQQALSSGAPQAPPRALPRCLREEEKGVSPLPGGHAVLKGDARRWAAVRVRLPEPGWGTGPLGASVPWAVPASRPGACSRLFSEGGRPRPPIPGWVLSVPEPRSGRPASMQLGELPSLDPSPASRPQHHRGPVAMVTHFSATYCHRAQQKRARWPLTHASPRAFRREVHASAITPLWS